MGELHLRIHGSAASQASSARPPRLALTKAQSHKDSGSEALRLGGLNPIRGMGELHSRVHGSALLHASLCLLLGAPFQLSSIPVPFVINDAGDDGAEGVGDPVGQLDGASGGEGLPEFIESAVE